jgi:hypothetical protein
MPRLSSLLRRWSMLRRSYLAVLVLLQIALASEVARPLARLLAAEVAAAAGRGATLRGVQLACTALVAVGAAIVLGGPVVAFARHVRRGGAAFGGVPRWAVAVALAGAALVVAALAGNVARPLLPAALRGEALVAARAVLAAGIALAAAGALYAELLRRSPPPPVIARGAVDAAARIEVTAPFDLRTRAT